MKIDNDLSDQAVLEEIGRRLTQHRLNQNKTQALLAQQAGISLRTMIRAEHGESVQASSLIRILRALRMAGNLEIMIPEPGVSPIQQLKLHGKRRQRASSKPDKPSTKSKWSWGDEE